MRKYIAVMCAMASEAKPLLSQVKVSEQLSEHGIKIYTGTFYNKDVLIAVTGVGMVNMAVRTAFVSMNYDVRCFLNYGIVGGYGESVHKGDIIAVKDCININSTQIDRAAQGEGISLQREHLVTFSENIDNSLVIYTTDEKYVALIKEVCSDAIIGRTGSGDVWNREYDKIMHFYNDFGVNCEEMECYAMYQTRNKFGIPALSVKGVSNNEVLGEKYDYSVMDKLTQVISGLLKIIPVSETAEME